MIRVGVCDGKSVVDDVPPHKISERLCQAECVLWVDVKDPDEDDWKTLIEEFAFHPLAIEDARKQNQRSKMDFYPTETADTPGYLFFALRAWSENEQSEGVVNGTSELDVFVGYNYIVTIHMGDHPTVEETRHRWQTNFVDMKGANDRPAYLLYLLLDVIVDEFFPVVDEVDANIEEIEIAIYEDGNQRADMRKAIRLKRKLLFLRQAVTPLRDLLNQLLRTNDEKLIPASLRVYLQDVYDHTLRIIEQVDLHRDILSGAMEATMAQTGNRLNQVMKTMTAVSTILMSATVLSGIYGMNFDNIWLQHYKYGFELACGVMVVVALAIAAFFKRIDWL